MIAFGALELELESIRLVETCGACGAAVSRGRSSAASMQPPNSSHVPAFAAAPNFRSYRNHDDLTSFPAGTPMSDQIGMAYRRHSILEGAREGVPWSCLAPSSFPWGITLQLLMFEQPQCV